MKRFMAVILAVAMLSVLAIMPVSAASVYTLRITNTDATVTVGDTFDVVITIDDVASGNEIAAVDFYLEFNSDYVQPEYNQTATGDNSRFVATPGDNAWEHIISIEGDSYHCILAADDTGYDASTGGASESALGNGDTLTITLPFTVLDAAAGKVVSFALTEVVAYDALDAGFASPISGSVVDYSFTAASKNIPVTTIGAKINTAAPALRLGAKYEAAQLNGLARADVEDIGIVFYPTRLLGSNELTPTTSGAMKLSAMGIEGYVEGNVFEDYDSFIFYVTIINIPANGMDDLISYRAYLKAYDRAGGETFLAENTYERCYDYVYETLFPALGSGSGDNAILPDNGWFE